MNGLIQNSGYKGHLLFSKKLFNQLKAFDLAFFYINYGFI